MYKTKHMRLALPLIVFLCAISLLVGVTNTSLELPALEKGEVLIQHKGFSLVYSEKDEQAKWVAYTLTPEKVNSKIVNRDKESFRKDPLISTGSAEDKDYNKSSYSRGHLCPANDNTWSKEAMHDCFYFSNMSPQRQEFNGGIWKDLELYVHNLATLYDTLYVVTGPVLISDKPLKTIGKNEVSVPGYYYKVIMVYGKEPKAIGYLIPQSGYEKDFQAYACTVDEVERVTGVDFYYKLDDMTEKVIESKQEDIY
ncbi:MAG: DNA/RNA non-specific endonuclease, partial [Candidatus Cloacimonetes bacterium]|nr:DNA/RNA non-specific endonuclease [Candidatus Cloacimonadota bacterium]